MYMDVARFSPTDYLTMLERFVTNGDVFEFETNVQMDFPRAINYDPILLYLQRLMKDPLIQSRVLGSRLAGKVFYYLSGQIIHSHLPSAPPKQVSFLLLF